MKEKESPAIFEALIARWGLVGLGFYIMRHLLLCVVEPK
jgi:hypothetical protein